MLAEFLFSRSGVADFSTVVPWFLIAGPLWCEFRKVPVCMQHAELMIFAG